MYRLRFAGRDDVHRLGTFAQRIYAAHFGHVWGASALPAYLDAHYGSARLGPDLDGATDARWLLAEDEIGALAGFAKLRRDRPLPTDPQRRGLELEKLYIDPERTGAGLGSRMLEACAGCARDEGAARIWLDVLKDNVGARRLYQRHGYEVVGEIGYATDQRELGMWVMQREPP